MSALAVAAVLALGGCTGGDPDPEPSSPASTDASESPAPTPSPSASTVPKPERPAEMDRTDEAGAAAAAKYFLSMYAYVMQTGNVEEWDALTTSACEFCLGIRAAARENADSNIRYFGGEINITTLEVGARDEALDAYAVETTVDQRASQKIAEDGAVVDDSVGQKGHVRVEIINRPEGWGVLSVIRTVLQ